MKSFYAIGFSLFFVCNIVAQQKLPTLKTNINALDVREGNLLKKGIWQLATDIDVDVYEADNKNTKQNITFYSDIDSLTFSVQPDSAYDFVILLNNNTIFKSRISTRINRYRKNCNGCLITSDTIPFSFAKDGRILIKGEISEGKPLNFMFDTGADNCWLYTEGFKKMPNLIFQNSGTVVGGVGKAIPKNVSFNNKFQLSELIWDKVDFDYWGGQLKKYDGGIGYKVFEGNTLEIDFENKNLIAHNALPKISDEYTKCRLEKRGGLYFIELQLKVGDKIITEWFDFDTGNSGTMNINEVYASKEGLLQLLTKMGESKAEGVDGIKRKTDKVMLPTLLFGSYQLNDIPVFLDSKSDSKNAPFSIIGIEILKRFHIIIDYKNNCVYLKPNSGFNTAFNNGSNSINYLVIGLIAFGLILGGFIVYKRIKKLK